VRLLESESNDSDLKWLLQAGVDDLPDESALQRMAERCQSDAQRHSGTRSAEDENEEVNEPEKWLELESDLEAAGDADVDRVAQAMEAAPEFADRMDLSEVRRSRVPYWVPLAIAASIPLFYFATSALNESGSGGLEADRVASADPPEPVERANEDVAPTIVDDEQRAVPRSAPRSTQADSVREPVDP
jgi:hypothetical protein